MKIICVCIGSILMLRGFLYAAGFKDNVHIDGPEISGFFFSGLGFIILPFLV